MASPAGSKGGIPEGFGQELRDLRAADFVARKAADSGEEAASPQGQPTKTEEKPSE